MPYIMDTSYPSTATKFSANYLGWNIGEGAETDCQAERDRRYEVASNGISNGFRALEREELPHALVIDAKRKSDVHDYDNPVIVSLGRSVWVRSDFKAIIEELDGDVHQFIEMPILCRDLEPIKGSWSLLNVMAHQKTLIAELSAVDPHPTNPSLGMIVRDPKKVTLDENKLSSVSLWREENYPKNLFVSDRLRAVMKEKAIRFAMLHKTKPLK